ncbi:MAG TPA: glycosyltransferase [Gemmatimonadaceae bacterium]|nr:glycosyltransferase [Gemmatimonadaceae bacterium]
MSSPRTTGVPHDAGEAAPAPLSILHLLAPGAAGGLESVVRALAAGHARQGHTVRVVAVLDAPDSPAETWLEALAGEGAEPIPLHIPGRQYRRERRAVAELCRRLRPAVVHSHGYRSDVVGAAGARASGVPTVTTVHGFTGGGWKNGIYEYLQLRSFRRFDAVVAVSRPLVDRLGRAGVPRDRLHLVPNAFDDRAPRLGRAEARRALGVTGDAFLVGWVGRLSAEKGADVLLDAVARLRDLPLTVAVVGEGRERAELERRAESLGIAHRVRWAGLVPDAGRLFAGFDTFVLSSRSEGTPIALFEAMAAGVPIVATRVGGVPDVVTDTEALLVPPERPDRLAGAIEAVHREPLAAHARARRARERLTTRFALEPWLARYDAIYRQLQRASTTRR